MGGNMLRYGRASRPPPAVLLSSIAQHMGLMAVTLIFPLLVAQAAGVDARTQAHYLALAMLAMGVSTLLQAAGRRVSGIEIGSGYLLPAVFTAAYLPAALAAAKAGGLGAVAGMTIAGGLTQMVLARSIMRLRPYLPIEIVGLVVLLIGLILGSVAFRLVMDFGQGHAPALAAVGPALVALAIMIGFAAWGTPLLRAVAVLLGLAAGTVLHGALALSGLTALGTGPAPEPLVAISWPLATPSITAGLLPGFLAGALACTLRSLGDIVASQRANTADWRRPDYPNIQAGVLADGLGTFLAGLIGTMGLNTYSASVGLSVATEVKARRVAVGVGIGWIVLALIPGSALLVMAIPRSVLGAALLFASAFIVLSGISILGQRLLDARRTLVVGLGFLIGLSFDQLPAFYQQNLPPVLQPVVNSSLILGLFTALGLNALFRLGGRKVHRLVWRPGAGLDPLHQFLREAGAAEGARADGIARLVLVAEEFATTAPSLVDGVVEITVLVDDPVLTLTFAWDGRPLEPGPKPTLDPAVDEDAVMNGVALALMIRLSDRLTRSTGEDGRHNLVCEVEQ